ncbi:MAG: heavy metal translocating P-type ATPase [Bdellovibrionales bacterium]|nr:heavy metal translocating P-type ATPase [Bdellovibrionales bacterium]
MSDSKHQHDHEHGHKHDHGHSHTADSCCTPLASGQNVVQHNTLINSTTSVFSVSGMDCADEIAAIQKALAHSQIGKVSANLMSSQVSVEHDPSLSKEQIVALINSAGVKVQKTRAATSFYANNKSRVWLVVTSGVLLGIGLLADWFTEAPAELLFSVFLLSTLTGGALIAPKAWRALKQKSLDMNVLMTLAATGAFLIQEFSEGAAVVFLFSLAEMLEAFSVARARKAIQEVLSITPQVATVEDETGTRSVPVEDVAVGQAIVILAGDRIPLDGVVIKGSSSVHQAPLTGESQPVSKNVGDTILAGTINESGTLKAQVTHTFKDSKISNVIRLIEEAQSKKAPAQLFVDKFSRVYTPIVTLIAVLVALLPPLLFAGEWDVWFYRSLVFLVIACPCALVIATPVSIVSALTALARAGVLVKGGVYLESLGKLRALAVDKTGTITEGVPRVVSMTLVKPGSEAELLDVIHALEKESSHPLARAAVRYCEDKGSKAQEVHDFKVIQGKGIEGRIGEHLYFAGNHKLAHEFGVCSPEIEAILGNLEDQAQSVLVVGHKPHMGCAGEVLGILGLADEPRSNVIEAIRGLHKAGITEISMLSGDNQRTVNSIAKRVGIDSAKGDLLPEDKVREMQALLERHTYVGMVGDGINDAPALAQATIGIAMGAAGTDAAIETADVALMTDDLSQMARAIEHGRKTLRIIRFNISFALVTKAIFLVLGAFGYSSLWLAVAADMGATLLVIANSLRLLRVRV